VAGEDPPRHRRTAEEANLGIAEATIRQLLEEAEQLIEEVRAGLDVLEAKLTKMRQKHEQIVRALARASERRKP
jgi:hypothetical protein